MKQKTHSGTKDRFKVSRNGKVRSGSKNHNHLLEKKSSSRKRRIKGYTTLPPAEAKRVKRLLKGN